MANREVIITLILRFVFMNLTDYRIGQIKEITYIFILDIAVVLNIVILILVEANKRLSY